MTDLSIDQLRRRAQETEAEPGSDERLVAVLIMVVSVLAAFTAYLQVQAGSRESTASRNAQQASVVAMSSIVRSSRNFSQQSVTASSYSDLDWLHYYLKQNAPTSGAPDYANALSRSYESATKELQGEVNRLFKRRYLLKEAGFDFNQFYEDEQKPGYRAAEEQKAAAALWGILVYAGSVEKPSPSAINLFVEGAARLDRASLEEERDQPRYFRDAARHLSDAIAAKDDYREAYIRRGSASLSPKGRARGESLRGRLTEDRPRNQRVPPALRFTEAAEDDRQGGGTRVRAGGGSREGDSSLLVHGAETQRRLRVP